MSEEKRLIARLKRGEKDAFAELVERYGPPIHRLVLRYAPASEADDLTQEIFVEVWRGIGKFRGEAALSTWLYRIAVNRCFRYGKREKRDTASLDEAMPASRTPLSDNSPYRLAVQSETANRVHRAVDDLPDGQREVVILCELHELTYTECAAVLEIPVGTVKSRLSHATRKLRESLRDYVLNDLSPLPALKEAAR